MRDSLTFHYTLFSSLKNICNKKDFHVARHLVDENDPSTSRHVGCQDKGGPGKIHEVILVKSKLHSELISEERYKPKEKLPGITNDFILFVAITFTTPVMNNSSKTCVYFENVWPKFDDSEEFFITNIALCLVNIIFSLATCIANVLFIFAVAKTPDLQSPSFVLLGCLAASDLLVGLICQPLLVAVKIAELEENLTAFCNLKKVQFLSGWATSGASFLLIAAVSVDRVLCLVLHLRYSTLVTVPRVLKCAFILWIFSITFVITRFWMGSAWHFIAYLVFFLPLLVITVSTLKIFQFARRHQRQINDQTMAVSHLQPNTVNALKCRKSAVTVLYIYGLSLIFYSPYLLVTIIDIYVAGFTRTVRIIYDYAGTTIFINSFLNPLVYCWRVRMIRRAVRNVLRKERQERY